MLTAGSAEMVTVFASSPATARMYAGGSAIVSMLANAATAAEIDASGSGRHDGYLFLAQGAHRLRIQLQMCLHQFGRRQCHPLIQRYIGVIAALEDLQET